MAGIGGVCVIYSSVATSERPICCNSCTNNREEVSTVWRWKEEALLNEVRLRIDLHIARETFCYGVCVVFIHEFTKSKSKNRTEPAFTFSIFSEQNICYAISTEFDLEDQGFTYAKWLASRVMNSEPISDATFTGKHFTTAVRIAHLLFIPTVGDSDPPGYSL